ncbi:MAG: type II secretion system F family protein [Bdellovibrionales bacterium]|nr:type II secretion system F family protein [Bdellovibrionales bacterium]
MGTFLFKARRPTGEVVSGKVQAKTKNEVIYLLNSKKLEVIHIEMKKNVFQLGSGGVGGISSKSLVHFTRQMAFLINAGVPVVQSLQIMKRITKDLTLQKVVADLANSIEKGSTFANALAEYPSIFSSTFVSIIEAGEVGGSLDIMLNRLAEYIEESEKLKSKMLKAMMYPSFVLSVGLIIVVVIMVKVVPQFTSIFSSSDVKLPPLTQLLISISDAFRYNLIWIIVFGFFIPFCFILYLRSSSGRYLKDQLLMLMPVIGPLVLKNSLARFSRTFACLLSGGVNVADALKTSGLVSNNFFIEKSIKNVRNEIVRGKSIASSLKKEPIIPTLISDMVAIGEETGNTEATLTKVAEFYEEQVKTTSNAISELIQPVLIAVLGGLVGFIVIALYLPIFKLPGVAGGF